MNTISFSIGQYTLSYREDQGVGLDFERADLVDELDGHATEGKAFCLTVARGLEFPFLVVAQRYEPAGGFRPAVLIVPESNLLFIGAGERLVAYDLDGPTRLWMDSTPCGFWGWARHGDRIVLSAELELAAWDIQGRKCWSTFVEPPWTYRVSGAMIDLDVMGTKSRFPLDAGPA